MPHALLLVQPISSLSVLEKEMEESINIIDITKLDQLYKRRGGSL